MEPYFAPQLILTEVALCGVMKGKSTCLLQVLADHNALVYDGSNYLYHFTLTPRHFRNFPVENNFD